VPALPVDGGQEVGLGQRLGAISLQAMRTPQPVFLRDVSCDIVDALIEAAPVGDQVLDDVQQARRTGYRCACPTRWKVFLPMSMPRSERLNGCQTS
jgi:hypothetical protein